MSLSTKDLGPFYRVLRIVAWCRAQERPWTARQLAEANEMHRQTAEVFVRSLVAQDLVRVSGYAFRGTPVGPSSYSWHERRAVAA